MANLLPPIARTKIKREYWLRVITVWVSLLGTAFLMLATLQIPAYVLVTEQLKVFNNWYNETGVDKDQLQYLSDVTEYSNSLSLLLNNNSESILFSDVMSEVEMVATDLVEIDNIKLVRNAGKIEAFTITGKAKSRIKLADFRNNLETSEMFGTATLPLANLAKDIDVPFTITVTMVTADNI